MLIHPPFYSLDKYLWRAYSNPTLLSAREKDMGGLSSWSFQNESTQTDSWNHTCKLTNWCLKYTKRKVQCIQMRWVFPVHLPTQNFPDTILVSSDPIIPLRLLQVTQFQRSNTPWVFMFIACPILTYTFLCSWIFSPSCISPIKQVSFNIFIMTYFEHLKNYGNNFLHYNLF